MSQKRPDSDDDGAMKLAEQAYHIYRGMKADQSGTPHWSELTREQQGLHEWTVRWAWMHGVSQ